jgi:hypothetical protein
MYFLNTAEELKQEKYFKMILFLLLKYVLFAFSELTSMSLLLYFVKMSCSIARSTTKS